VVPQPPEKVWKALTTAKLIGDWDGVVHCEVLEIVPHRRLVYSWKGGSDSNNSDSNYGSKLDSVVTWTLQPEGRGTRLRLVHTGFRSPQNDFAYDAMSPGWGRIMGRLSEIAAAL
jgi:uncharacterized protein YndB with AHSA1/START domain